MNELLQDNYARLRRQYFVDAKAAVAAKRIGATTTPKKQQKLKWLLRHHDERRIRNRETWERDEIDELLHFYSVMEVAALLELIPSPLPTDLRRMALRHLSQPAVNKYYVMNYPLVLPQLFLLRAAGFMNLTDGSEGASFPAFVRLLQLDATIHGGDEDVDIFLWFLDGGAIEGFDIEDTIRKFKSAKKFFRSLTKRRKHMTIADSSVRGCVLFLNFCREIDSFLSSGDISPLLRFESWHLYDYWFSNLQAMVGDRISDMIDTAGGWTAKRDTASKRQKEKRVAELRGILRRLLSGDYGRLPGLPSRQIAQKKR